MKAGRRLALLREVAPDQRENRQDAKGEGGLGPDILALRYPLFLGVLGALAVRFPVRLPAVMLVPHFLSSSLVLRGEINHRGTENTEEINKKSLCSLCLCG
jgi:hypothetical protein